MTHRGAAGPSAAPVFVGLPPCAVPCCAVTGWSCAAASAAAHSAAAAFPAPVLQAADVGQHKHTATVISGDLVTQTI